MRVVLQRCLKASVLVDSDTIGSIDRGFMLLVGVAPDDSIKEVEWMCNKVIGLRIFPDCDGKMNHSVMDIKGEVLVVSQFTLYGNCRKGRRPSFTRAGHPSMAEPLVKQFCQMLRAKGVLKVDEGRFGADMKVSLVNDGPVTLIIDTPEN